MGPRARHRIPGATRAGRGTSTGRHRFLRSDQPGRVLCRGDRVILREGSGHETEAPRALRGPASVLSARSDARKPVTRRADLGISNRTPARFDFFAGSSVRQPLEELVDGVGQAFLAYLDGVASTNLSFGGAQPDRLTRVGVDEL